MLFNSLSYARSFYVESRIFILPIKSQGYLCQDDFINWQIAYSLRLHSTSALWIYWRTHTAFFFSSSCILQCALGSFSLNLLGLHKSSALWMKKLIHKTRFYEHPSNLSSCVGNKTRSPHTHPMTTLQNPDIQIIFYLANDSNPLKKVAQHVGVPQEMAHMCAWKGEGGCSGADFSTNQFLRPPPLRLPLLLPCWCSEWPTALLQG